MTETRSEITKSDIYIVFKNIYNVREVVKCTRKMFHQSEWRGFLKKRLQPPFKKAQTKRPSQVLLWFIGVEDADISLWNDLSVNKQSSLTLRNWPLSSVVFSSGSVFSVELSYGTALKDAFWSGFLRNLVIHRYRAFSLTWPTSMQFFWNNRKPLHKKRVNYHWIGLEHQHSRCSLFWNTNGHRCENTLYGKEVTMFSKKSRSAIRHNSDPALRASSKWTIADAKAAMLVDKKKTVSFRCELKSLFRQILRTKMVLFCQTNMAALLQTKRKRIFLFGGSLSINGGSAIAIMNEWHFSSIGRIITVTL